MSNVMRVDGRFVGVDRTGERICQAGCSAAGIDTRADKIKPQQAGFSEYLHLFGKGPREGEPSTAVVLRGERDTPSSPILCCGGVSASGVMCDVCACV